MLKKCAYNKYLTIFYCDFFRWFQRSWLSTFSRCEWKICIWTQNYLWYKDFCEECRMSFRLNLNYKLALNSALTLCWLRHLFSRKSVSLALPIFLLNLHFIFMFINDWQDLKRITPFVLSTYTNSEVIAINQDIRLNNNMPISCYSYSFFMVLISLNLFHL